MNMRRKSVHPALAASYCFESMEHMATAWDELAAATRRGSIPSTSAGKMVRDAVARTYGYVAEVTRRSQIVPYRAMNAEDIGI